MGRKSKYIENLTEEQKSSLKKGYTYGKSPLYRRKCHCILLSHSGKTTGELADFFDVTLHSVRVWLRQWEQEGQQGLKLKPGRGRPLKLNPQTDQHVKTIKTLVKNEPKNLRKVVAQVEDQLGIEVSKKTLKRFLKKLKYRWKRFRRRLKGSPDPEVYKTQKALLKQLMKLEDTERIDLLFSDDTGLE